MTLSNAQPAELVWIAICVVLLCLKGALWYQAQQDVRRLERLGRNGLLRLRARQIRRSVFARLTVQMIFLVIGLDSALFLPNAGPNRGPFWAEIVIAGGFFFTQFVLTYATIYDLHDRRVVRLYRRKGGMR